MTFAAFILLATVAHASSADTGSAGGASPDTLHEDYQHFFAGHHHAADEYGTPYVDEDGELKDKEVYQWRAYRGVRRSLASRILYDLGIGKTATERVVLIIGIFLAVYFLRGRSRRRWTRPLFSGRGGQGGGGGGRAGDPTTTNTNTNRFRKGGRRGGKKKKQR